MKEKVGNIWVMNANAVCVPTNGIVKPNGEAVMGAGVAKQAVNLVPGLKTMLGKALNTRGNHVHVFWEALRHYNGHLGQEWCQDLVTFPTKIHWRDASNLQLIKRSCVELMHWADECLYWENILLPRPGCGLGKLDWNIVKPAIEPLLDNRVTIVSLYE